MDRAVSEVDYFPGMPHCETSAVACVSRVGVRRCIAAAHRVGQCRVADRTGVRAIRRAFELPVPSARRLFDGEPDFDFDIRIFRWPQGHSHSAECRQIFEVWTRAALARWRGELA